MKNICKQVAWTIIVTWLSFNGFIAIATAQVRPPRRKHRTLISKQKPKKEKTDATVGVGESLIDIAHRASRQKQSQMVDLVFVIDAARVGSSFARTPSRWSGRRVWPQRGRALGCPREHRRARTFHPLVWRSCSGPS